MSNSGTNTSPFMEPRLIEGGDAAGGAEPGSPLRLAASRCDACDRVDFPRRPTCPSCLAPTSDVALAEGAVLGGSTSVLHPPPGAMVETPYHLGVAAFPEGISVLGQLLVDSLDQIAIGDPLEVVATEVDGTVTYAFRPA